MTEVHTGYLFAALVAVYLLGVFTGGCLFAWAFLQHLEARRREKDE